MPVKHVDEWREASIDQRTAVMTEALLAAWPVPEGHVGAVADSAPAAEKWVEIKHLLAAGLLAPGTVLTARPGNWGTATATITTVGLLEVNGVIYESPSAAGTSVRGGSTNGWKFWRLEDGRFLSDVRASFRGDKPAPSRGGFDWAPMHTILEALPTGQWTSYSELADAVGTAPQPLGNHITTCPHCANAWRVLTWDGRIAPQFTWSDPEDTRDPQDLLLADGVRLVDGKADPAQMLRSDELAGLVEESTVDA